MVKLRQGYFGNLFTKTHLDENENKETNIKVIQLIHLDEPSGCTNKPSQKSEWIIQWIFWMEMTDGETNNPLFSDCFHPLSWLSFIYVGIKIQKTVASHFYIMNGY